MYMCTYIYIYICMYVCSTIKVSMPLYYKKTLTKVDFKIVNF